MAGNPDDTVFPVDIMVDYVSGPCVRTKASTRRIRTGVRLKARENHSPVKAGGSHEEYQEDYHHSRSSSNGSRNRTSDNGGIGRDATNQ